MSSKGNSDSAKQAWGRLMVAAIGTYGNLIKDAEFTRKKGLGRPMNLGSHLRVRKEINIHEPLYTNNTDLGTTKP
jgi:hypothetical protein